MNYYVFLLGPYDSCYVGPFADETAVQNFNAAAVDANIDSFVLTQEAFDRDIEEYGDAPVYASDEYILQGDYDYDGQPDEAKEWEDFGEVYDDGYPLYDGGEY